MNIEEQKANEYILKMKNTPKDRRISYMNGWNEAVDYMKIKHQKEIEKLEKQVAFFKKAGVNLVEEKKCLNRKP